MDGKSHMTIGIMASVGISAVFLRETQSLPSMGCFVLMTAIGSYLPDVDHPTSTISRICPPLSSVIKKFFYSAGKMFGNSDYQNALHEHRGICHSFSACISTLLLLLFFFISNFKETYIFLGLILGMFLHILADSFTPAGTMLFAPFSLKRFFPHSNTSINVTPSSPVSAKCVFLYTLLYFCNLILSFSGFLYFLLILIVINTISEFMKYHNIDKITVLTFSILLGINVVMRFVRNIIVTKIHFLHNQQAQNTVPDISDKLADIPSDNIIPFDASRHKEND